MSCWKVMVWKCIFSVGFLFTCQVAWDQALHWGKKKKKSTSEVSGEGKATGPLPFSSAVGPCSRLHARSKWSANWKFVWTNGHLSWTLSVDWPLFWNLNKFGDTVISANNGRGQLLFFSHKKGGDYFEGRWLFKGGDYFKYCLLEVLL